MAAVYNTPKGGLYGGPFDSSGLDANTRSVMMDFRWTQTFGGQDVATQIKFSFPKLASDYLVVPGYPKVAAVSEFKELNDFEKDAVRVAFKLVESYTKLTFEEISSGLASNATFRFADDLQPGSFSQFPPNAGTYAAQDSRSAGDTFLGKNGQLETSAFYGTDNFNTIMHEMGHAFGLKHGHDPEYNGTLTADRNDNEFSIMTYASYFGADTSGATEAHVGSAPQSYMMYDIAALQAYYGANFDKVGSNATYTWSNSTGQQYINGAAAPNTGVTETYKIFSTVWTQGAKTTYDLSNFDGDQVDDMRPGQWMKFSAKQIADLNSDVIAGHDAYNNLAQGNVYNSLLYNGDTRSEISNLYSGSGNDKITGNDLDNIIMGNDGDDTIDGGGGANVLYGGNGNDMLLGGTATGGGINQLWGGDGIDTVSYEHQTLSVYVDLGVGAGYFKFGGAMVLADALNSIENAIGGTNNDVLIGDGLANHLDGGTGANVLYGLGGDDVFAGGTATGGVDQLWGGSGTNTVDYSAIKVDVTVDLGAGGGYVLRGSAMTLTDQMNLIQNAIGGAGDDRLIGDEGANRLDGGGGENALYGLGGDDVLVGGIYVGTPASTDASKIPTNQLWGGAGSNTVDYSAQKGSVYVDLGQQLGYVWYQGTLVLTDQMNSIQNVMGGKVGDTLIGNGGTNYFEGLGGADSLYAKGGVVTFGYTDYSDSNLKSGYDTIVDFILGISKIDLKALSTDFAHLQIETSGTSHSVYVEKVAGQFNIDTDLAISINTTVAGLMTASDFIFA